MGSDIPSRDRVTELRIRGLRTLEDVTLPLGRLTALVGENGVGKSSVAEACALLCRLGRESFPDAFLHAHGGFPGLLRRGADAIGLGLTLEGAGAPLRYDAPCPRPRRRRTSSPGSWP